MSKVYVHVTKKLIEALGKPKTGEIEAWHESYERKLADFDEKHLAQAVTNYIDNRRYETWPKPVELEDLAKQAQASDAFVAKTIWIDRDNEHGRESEYWLALAQVFGKPTTLMLSYQHPDHKRFGRHISIEEHEKLKLLVGEKAA
jgi:hypothetical protein